MPNEPMELMRVLVDKAEAREAVEFASAPVSSTVSSCLQCEPNVEHLQMICYVRHIQNRMHPLLKLHPSNSKQTGYPARILTEMRGRGGDNRTE